MWYIFENWCAPVIKATFGSCFTKTPVLALRKWKMVFLYGKIKKSYVQHCLPFKDAHVCPFWEKLTNYNIGRLP
jgi:hypothetical protein